MRPSRLPLDGLLYAAITFLTWGLPGVWTKLLPFNTTFIVGIRMLTALLGLIPLLLLSRERRSQFAVAIRNPIAWLLSAAITLYYLLGVSAFRFGSVAQTALLIGSAPLFIFISRIYRHQPISARQKTGFVLALIGVVVVLAPGLFASANSAARQLIGAILALSAASTSAVYAGTYRELHERQRPAPSPIIVGVLSSAIGGAALTIIGSALHPDVWNHVFESRNIAIFLAFGLISTAVPSITYAIAARLLPAVTVTTSQLMIPVTAAIYAALILRELPAINVYLGGALVLYGILHMMRQDETHFEEGEEPLLD